MRVKAATIAGLTGGKIEGDPEKEISGPGGIETATEDQITFLGNLKYEHYLYSGHAGVVIIPEDLILKEQVASTLIRVKDVYAAVGILLKAFEQKNEQESRISEHAIVSSDARVGSNVSIGAFTIVEAGVSVGDGVVLGNQVYIGKNCTIGQGSNIGDGVKIYYDCELGTDCIIQANTVVGSDGFGYSRDESGQFTRVPQIGKVILGDRVELGACVTIDRATMGATVLENGVKVDNLVHIAHNVRIGADSAIAAQAGIAGSTKLGSQVLVGGQVGISGHISIASKTEIQAKSGISSVVKEEGSRLFGYPAMDYMAFVRSFTIFKKLPEMWKRLNELEQFMKK
jgi:UDP-3-O-[3-hydroxymyristoyl] glucosamine N-acyltransferase